jgi:predicted NACHT family NTPase
MFSWKLDCTFTRDFSKAVTFKDTPEFNLFDNLLLDLHLSRIYIFTLYFNRPFALNSEFNNILDISDELKQKLQKITSQLPKLTEDRSTFMQWWLAQGRNWADQLRSVMIKYRNIGHDWQFSAQEKKLLRQYYNANKLLVLCLNSSSNVSSEIRQEIEETLLLPISDIEKLQQRIL